MSFESYFATGERLLWSGQPRRGIRTWPNMFNTILGVPFLVAATFMLGHGVRFISGNGPLLDAATLAAGIVFGGFGLYLTVGVWIAEATRHRRIRYAMTDRACYISEGARVDRVPLAEHPIDATVADDGSGTILFGPRDKWNRNKGRASFEDIADAAHVAKLMEGLT